MEKTYVLQFIDVEENEVVSSTEYELEDAVNGLVLEFEFAEQRDSQIIITDDRGRSLSCIHQRTEIVHEENKRISKLFVKTKVEIMEKSVEE